MANVKVMVAFCLTQSDVGDRFKGNGDFGHIVLEAILMPLIKILGRKECIGHHELVFSSNPSNMDTLQ